MGTTKTFEQAMSSEVGRAVENLLQFIHWPYMFHQVYLLITLCDHFLKILMIGKCEVLYLQRKEDKPLAIFYGRGSNLGCSLLQHSKYFYYSLNFVLANSHLYYSSNSEPGLACWSIQKKNDCWCCQAHHYFHGSSITIPHIVGQRCIFSLNVYTKEHICPLCFFNHLSTKLSFFCDLCPSFNLSNKWS